jgi:hypothetical protein
MDRAFACHSPGWKEVIRTANSEKFEVGPENLDAAFCSKLENQVLWIDIWN